MRAGWRVPAGLIGLSALPLVVGAVRLGELAGQRDAGTLPLMLHIVGAMVFSLLGALQVASGVRRRWPGWHRVAGRMAVPGGLLAGGTGVWLGVVHAHGDGDGGLLGGFRVVFGGGMLVFLLLGFVAIRRREVARHRAWMMRGYAIALGAGTQAVLLSAYVAIAGTPAGVPRALVMGAAWVINLVVAELVIRGQRRLVS
ncbi:DUF2306 domain-containing protein [Nonomuraea typhae]|uniref:DUF2306 domain-containing protein n=1 Tax=Nonomuraea typhae TaxID=2603600 RepID=A0ABW7Z208_9ACTN